MGWDAHVARITDVIIADNTLFRNTDGKTNWKLQLWKHFKTKIDLETVNRIQLT